MKLFVTGATGFIGRALAARLLDLGHEVCCLARKAPEPSELAGRTGLTWVRGDLADPRSYGSELRGAQVVFHLAGLTKARTRQEYLAANGSCTGLLADTASATGSRVEKIVYVSSLAVAGPHTAAEPATEEQPPRPITHYGESKLLGERLLLDRAGPWAWTILRPPVVYGPYDRDLYLCFQAAARGLVPLLRGGRMQLSLVHVTDAVAAIALAGLSERANGMVYYLSDGAVHTSADVAKSLVREAPRARVLPVPDWLLRLTGLLGDAGAAVSGRPAVLNSQKVREACQEGWVCSCERIRGELGFSPSVDIQRGFSETFRWYRENGWL